MAGIEIPGKFILDEADVAWQFLPSPGPGGQHVNRAATQARLSFSPGEALSVPEHFREQLLLRLASRLSAGGVLQIASCRYRSQRQNREDAMRKLAAVLTAALTTPKKRRPTRPTGGAVERRLKSKRIRSSIKQTRRRQAED